MGWNRIFAASVAVMALSACLSGCVSLPKQDLETRAFSLVNKERIAAGLEPLVMDDNLQNVARAHSRDMAARNFTSHDNPDGLSPFQRLDAAGIRYGWAGENIAWNNFSTPAEVAVKDWMESPEHSVNILRPQFTRSGMGIAADGAGGYYFTQIFIGPDPSGR